MNKQNIYFGILIAVTGIFSLVILSNFIIVLLLAYVFSTLVRPVFARIETGLSKINVLKKISNTIAAFTTIILFLLVIVTPIAALLSQVVIDAQSVYQNISSGDVNITNISERFTVLADRFAPNINLSFNKVAASVSGFFVGNIGNLFTGTVDIALKLFLFLFAMFYFLKDGKQFRELYTNMSPLKKENDGKILDSIRQSINSIMIGSVTVAVAQGIATGLGLWIFGVPNPFFFGTLAGFLALIPGIGAPFVWIPAAIYLYFVRDGSFVWLYLVIWGITAVGLIDNIIGPKVINKGIKIHHLFILLSIIGGISVFGPEGVILGPLILSVFVSIIKVWNEEKSL